MNLNERLNQHMAMIRRCTLPSQAYGRLLLATPQENRYPYIYPRDASSAVTLFRRLATSRAGYDCAEEAFDLARSVARFICDVNGTGLWGQRYGTDGSDKSIYRQEDNVAHGMAILCNYLLAAHTLGRHAEEADEFLEVINRAASWALEHLYHQELNLFASTTAIHESALEEGFTCWVNFSFLYAFSLLDEVARKLDSKGILAPSHITFRKHFLYSVSELFLFGGRFVRRITATGRFDLRPDITLMSPFYFGFFHYRDEVRQSIAFLEKQLWDSELGMIVRYLPFERDFAVHLHAGHGPWLQYTAILAQYHYWTGNTERGDQLLALIDAYRTEAGEIPEHISTCERFERFMETEWRTGQDAAKEFHKPILLDNLEFDKILEETNNMARSYEATARFCVVPSAEQPGRGYIQFAAPLMWSHVEYARALLMRAGDWWRVKKGEHYRQA